MPSAEPHLMQCMEVWGGNQPVEGGVVMAGLDAWVYCKPFQCAAAGGDVYYVSSCATGRITRLLVADVSGHGDAVGATAAELRTLMRRFVNHIEQSSFVASMNRQFTELARGGCFATAVVTTFFAPTNGLSLCNAGHPPPLLYRTATRTWDYIDASCRPPGNAGDRDDRPDNFPLGIIDLASYGQFDVKLRVGDLVLCYTDSLPEARCADGEMLGQDGLLDVVRSLDVSDPSGFVPSLLREIERRCGTPIAGDDITVLLFRPNGLAPKIALAQRLKAPFRVARELVRSMRTGAAPPWPEMSVANVGGALFERLSRFTRRPKRPAAAEVERSS